MMEPLMPPGILVKSTHSSENSSGWISHRERTKGNYLHWLQLLLAQEILLPLKERMEGYFDRIMDLVDGMAPLILRWINRSQG